MAGQAEGLRPQVCEERQRLSAAFTDAARDLIEIYHSETADLAAGGTGLPRSDLALIRARRKRDDAKAELLRHIRFHGCE